MRWNKTPGEARQSTRAPGATCRVAPAVVALALRRLYGWEAPQGQRGLAIGVGLFRGTFAAVEKLLNNAKRLGRLGLLAVFAFVVTGCCVLPFGEGRGGRGHYSGTYQGSAHGGQFYGHGGR